ncbi:MAG: vitamin K epoxide reductase family protein [Candidatus Nanoarchaeia archaeon]
MINYWITLLAVIGLGITIYIYLKKNDPSTMVCIAGRNCAEVIQSKYGKTFNIRNEYLGALYYLSVIILTILFLYSTTTILNVSILTILITLGIISVLFSIYLTYIQFFVLKATCDYCLGSAIVNVLILIMEII